MDYPNDFLVGDDYWNFLGGNGTFQELLKIFDEVGKAFKEQLQSKFKEIAAKKIDSYWSWIIFFYNIWGKNFMRDKIFYSLSFSDIQNVAQQELGRELTGDEIKKTAEQVSKSIHWYSIITDVLLFEFETEKT